MGARRLAGRCVSLSAPLCAVALAAACSAIGAPRALATAPVQAPAAAQPAHAVVKRLSDLRTLSRWAYPQEEAQVRSAPSTHAHAIGRLKFLTSDDRAQLYIALASEQLPSGVTWIRVELPERPNGRTGWVPRGALGALHAVRGYLRIDQARLRATLFRDGRSVFSAPVGVGKPGTVTPAGQFYVTREAAHAERSGLRPLRARHERLRAHARANGRAAASSASTGRTNPSSIPGRPSHGCIRMRDADIARLWHMIEVGHADRHHLAALLPARRSGTSLR